MGNQVLAEIRTNYALINSLKGFGAFLYKYVDDIFTSIHVDHIATVKERISDAANMELTVTNENENENFDIEFLDCVFQRNQDSSISSRWLKKDYELCFVSKRKKDYNSLAILNYHSYHPMNMKVNVVRQMIRHAFAITSSEFMKETKELLITILHNSSYASRFIANQLSAVLYLLQLIVQRTKLVALLYDMSLARTLSLL